MLTEAKTELDAWRVVTESHPTGTAADYAEGRSQFLDLIAARLKAAAAERDQARAELEAEHEMVKALQEQMAKMAEQHVAVTT